MPRQSEYMVKEKHLKGVRDFCGNALWTVVDSAGFSATGFGITV